jgi:hypothetical protein
MTEFIKHLSPNKRELWYREFDFHSESIALGMAQRLGFELNDSKDSLEDLCDLVDLDFHIINGQTRAVNLTVFPSDEQAAVATASARVAELHEKHGRDSDDADVLSDIYIAEELVDDLEELRGEGVDYIVSADDPPAWVVFSVFSTILALLDDSARSFVHELNEWTDEN